ncbi:hypothetical protein Pint_29786 [Pistacia integerrima]|uniref:Uncharacterized protein n=1 Tax=Pistacia integerrima TaxID=434235 RepID=A0ACC0X2L0_9ROSI|nr:hypothetical protein Pint_29786 [Pistacia integerrima]
MPLMIILSALIITTVGTAQMIERIQHKDYKGFDNLCSYTT